MQKKEMSRLEGHLLFGIQADALMMEQADSGKCHYHIVCVAGIDNILVAFGAAWLCHVCYAAAVSTLDIVTEWEKASEPSVTPEFPESHSRFSSAVNTGGFTLNVCSHTSSPSTSI